jgi:tripartite-type tricarboxylate transporter receptor subunit TctC
MTASFSMSRRALTGALLAGALPLPLRAADAAYPSRPVKFVNWSNPGGNLDIVGRLVGEQVSRRWGQAVVTDNRVGASGIIATDYVAKSAPDGYTVLITSSTGQLTNALVRLKLPFDPVRDFEPLSLMLAGNIALIASAAAPFNNLKELIQYAKAQSRPLTYGTWGIGTSAHLFGEYLRRQADINLLHVPYKGGEQGAMTDVVGGNLDLSFMSQGNAKIQIQGGKVKGLAITGPQRTKGLPDLPTFGEQGLRGFGVAGWIAAYAPAGMPKPIAAKIASTLREVLHQPEMSARLEDMGYEVIASTPEELRAFYQEDLKRWAELVKAAGIVPE